MAERGRSAAFRPALQRRGRVDGFASFRVKGGDSADNPAAEVQVGDIEAADPSAYAALWRFVLDLDLFDLHPGKRSGGRAAALSGCRLPMISTELTDSTYVRLVDVLAALQARTYAADLDVVIAVSDPLLPHNDWRFACRRGLTGRTYQPLGAAPMSLSRFVTSERSTSVAPRSAPARGGPGRATQGWGGHCDDCSLHCPAAAVLRGQLRGDQLTRGILDRVEQRRSTWRP